MKNDFNSSALELSKTLPREWRPDFIRYTMTGEADPRFLRWLETDKAGQAAAEAMFDKSAQALENLGRYIRSQGGKPLFGRKG
jgi:hypothetical protein